MARANNDSRVYLPSKDIFIIDTSILTLSRDEHIQSKIGGKAYELKLEKEKLEQITNQLSEMDNWFTIPEVIEEFVFIREHLKTLGQRLKDFHSVKKPKRRFSRGKHTRRNSVQNYNRRQKNNQIRENIRNFKRQIKETEELLSKYSFTPESIFQAQQLKEFQKSLPEIEQLHRTIGETPNELNTDCKLITTAVVYGLTEPITIYSQDNKLLLAFSQHVLQNHFDLKGNFSIINYKFDKRISCANFYNYATIKLTKPIHEDIPLIDIHKDGKSNVKPNTPSSRAQHTLVEQIAQL